MSRLSVGSSSSSRLWPSSSRQRISSRAFWPPESVSVERFAASWMPVARERAHRRLERAEPLLHDVEHAAALEVGARVELREQPGRDAVADPQLALVRDVLAGEQPDQVRLARAVRPDQPDALAEVDLVLERPHEPVDRDVAQRARRSARSRRRGIRTWICWSVTGAGGGPASTKRRQRVSAASARFALPSEIAARCFMIL